MTAVREKDGPPMLAPTWAGDVEYLGRRAVEVKDDPRYRGGVAILPPLTRR